jgi:hypothetical protein
MNVFRIVEGADPGTARGTRLSQHLTGQNILLDGGAHPAAF